MKKYIILLLLPFLFSCNTDPKEQRAGFYPVYITDTIIYNMEINYTDTASMVLYVYDCLFKIKKPYHLIQWNDGTYGIMVANSVQNKYKILKDNLGNNFSFHIEDGYHFKDSCEAKQDLQQYIDSQVTYKIVK